MTDLALALTISFMDIGLVQLAINANLTSILIHSVMQLVLVSLKEPLLVMPEALALLKLLEIVLVKMAGVLDLVAETAMLLLMVLNAPLAVMVSF